MAASLKQIAEFFGGTLSAFSTDWKALDETSKAQIRDGIGDGSLTY